MKIGRSINVTYGKEMIRVTFKAKQLKTSRQCKNKEVNKCNKFID